MGQLEKQREIDLLSETVGGSSSAFLVDFKGLDVARSTDLRVKLRAKDGRLRIVKNRLARRAFADGALAVLDEEMVGQTAVAYPLGDDVVSVAKVLRDFAAENDIAPVKACVVEGRLISLDEFKSLADLPSRDELIAKVVYLMQSPITGLAMTLNGVLRNFVMVLDAVRQQKETE